MLYVYCFCDYEEEEETLKPILKNIEGFKPFGYGMDYISNKNDIVVEGKNPMIEPLHEYISGEFDGGEVFKVENDLLDGSMKIPKERGVELLCDDLRVDGSYEFEQRIWKSDNAYQEVETIIKELTIDVLEMIIDELNYQYKKITEESFEWSY